MPGAGRMLIGGGSAPSSFVTVSYAAAQGPVNVNLGSNIATNDGMVIRYPESDIRSMGRAAAGVRGMGWGVRRRIGV